LTQSAEFVEKTGCDSPFTNVGSAARAAGAATIAPRAHRSPIVANLRPAILSPFDFELFGAKSASDNVPGFRKNETAIPF
jgi:hypothetical protein